MRAPTTVGVFALAGLVAGVVCDLIWARAALMDGHCYRYVSATIDGSCYDLGFRATREAGVTIAATLLAAAVLAVIAVLVVRAVVVGRTPTAAGPPTAARPPAASHRGEAVVVATLLAGAVLVWLAAIVPFDQVALAPRLAGSKPATPPLWVPPLLMISVFCVAGLIATGVRRRAGELLAVGLAVVAAVTLAPVGTEWQHHRDQTLCAGPARLPGGPNLAFLWC